MESAARKKRTLAERRESDKLRQRRFRAKKREEARLMQVIAGEVTNEKKERIYTGPRKTAEEIRETNRIRQQRFRAKKRGIEDPIEAIEVKKVKEEEPKVEAVTEMENPAELIQRFLLQAASDEKDRQTEIRREKDRIRKRRERQRKRERQAGLEGKTNEDRQCSEDPEEDTSSQFMTQLEQMGLLAGLLPSSSSPTAALNSSGEEAKKPWNRFNSADERRERERMRKRMYRARQKFITTGRLEMQWDPTPIKRMPNEDGEDEEDEEFSEDEEKLRLVNKRSRERNKSDDSSKSNEAQQDDDIANIDLTNLPSELYTELLATISKYDLSTLIGQNNQNDE